MSSFKSKEILIATILIMIISAQNTYSQAISYLDSLDGKFALQFQIDDNFNLTNFQGTTFSGKYHFGSRSAVRLGISVDLLSVDYESTETLLDTSLTNSSNGNQDGFGINLKMQYIHYIPGINNIVFFLGGGPFMSLNNTTAERNYPDTDPVNSRKDEINNFTVGIDLLIGVEWMFSKSMSLSAEYGIQFYHDSHTTKSEDIHLKRESTEEQLRIAKGDLNFGLSVYF